MSLEPEVHWEEGMFLRAQHLQMFARSLRMSLQRVRLQGGPPRHGITRLTIDRERLALFEFAVVELVATMPDGAMIAAPGNAEIEARAFRELMQAADGPLPVYLALPAATPGRPLTANAPDSRLRYRVVDREVVDENIAEAAEPIRLRLLRPRLLFGGEDLEGYELLEIAQVERAGELDPRPALRSDYVPPLVEIGGDRAFAQRLQGVVDTLRHAVERLAAEVARRPIGFSIESGADPEATWKLAAANSALAELEPLCTCPSVHPFEVHKALCAAIGGLAIFGKGRGLPRLPRYDHASLGPIFAGLVADVLELLTHVFAPTSASRPFAAVGAERSLFTCKHDKAWLEPPHDLLLAIDGELGNLDELDEFVASRLRLCGSRDVATIRQTVQPGILLRRVSPPPLSLPNVKNRAYYRLVFGETDAMRVRVLRDSEELALFCTAGPMPSFKFVLYAAGSPSKPSP